mgnify:CR=1 FL=1
MRRIGGRIRWLVMVGAILAGTLFSDSSTTENPLERLEKGIKASIRWYADHQDLVRVTLFCYTEEQFAQALLKGRSAPRFYL